MLTRLLKMFIVGYAFLMAFQNRYRIMNWILSKEKIRKWAVASSMRIPKIRNLFIQSAFGETTSK